MSLFKLRKTEPNLERSLRTGLSDRSGIALFLAVCLVAMAWFNPLIGCVFLGFMAAGIFLRFQPTAKQRLMHRRMPMSEGVSALGALVCRHLLY